MATNPRFPVPEQLHPQALPAYRDDGPTRTPPVGPATAIMRHPVVFLLVFVICAGAGVALGIMREPVYTAQARLSVGSNDVDSSILPAYVVATETLAGTYSRAITSRQVVVPTARELNRKIEDVAGHLSASPVPSSSTILVEATGSDAVTSARLVNAAGRRLVDFVRGIDPAGDGSAALLTRYRDAILERGRASRARTAAANTATVAPTSENEAKLRGASADLEAAKLKVSALASQYQSVQQRQPVTTSIRPLSYSTLGTSDFRSALQLRAFAGVIAGLLLGAALSTLIANRRRLRG